jgi:hypothetical protein
MREVIGGIAISQIVLNDPGILIDGPALRAADIRIASRDAVQVIRECNL